MNERIKLLAEQATSYMPGQPPYDGLTFDMFDKEKFAELIVRECIRVPYDMWDKAELNADIAVKIEHRIKEHFGVEERQKVAPKPKCSVCGTTENVKYMGGYQPYLCDSEDCVPF